MTNRKLFQFNMREDEECENCGEIISHLLYKCNTTKTIWESLKGWLQPFIREEVHIDEISCILGNENNTLLTNYIFIILKHEIYKFKWKKIPYRLLFLKRSLKNYMNIELYNGKLQGTERKVLGRWSPLINHLKYIH